MKSCHTTWKSANLALFLILLCAGVQAQVASLSPYSRFALGELQTQGNTVHRGMGGVTATTFDPYSVNGFNPASYSFLFRTCYNVDIRATRLNLDDGNEKLGLNGGGLNTVQFGFKKQGSKWGYGLGLRPFSSSGYDISISETDEVIGDIEKSYSGDGGLNVAHAGVSRLFVIEARSALLQSSTEKDTLAPRHTISIGANMEYFFGQLATTRRVRFADPGYYDTRLQQENQVQSINLTAGVLAGFNLRHKMVDKKAVTTDLVLGLTYTPERDARSLYSELNETIFPSGGSEFVTDTSYFLPESEGSMTIPARINAGVSLVFKDVEQRSWTVSADLKMQDWSAFKTDFDFLSDVTQLQAFQQLSLGFELTPRPTNSQVDKNILRASYRAGFRMADSYLTVRDNTLSEWAVSSGISIPIAKTSPFSKFHFGIEFGSRGTTPNKLVEETFIHAFAGFSFSPKTFWFVQKEYN